MNKLSKIKKAIQRLADPVKAKILQRFFKTGKGEYGEGDVFLGLTVPKQRKIAKEFVDLDFLDLDKLLKSKIHEHRLIALLVLVEKYQQASLGNSDAIRGFVSRKDIYKFYLNRTKHINNWDLVDLSADKILGRFLFETKSNTKILYKLSQSKNLWERRIALLSCFYFIKNRQFQETLKIAKILLKDNHDLIHKAAGWMLREVGKRDVEVLRDFLRTNHRQMPRTVLRYAIERFPEKIRRAYLLAKV